MAQTIELLFYGTLRHLDLLQTVLGHRIDPARLRPAVIPDHRALLVRGENFPMLMPAPGHMAPAAIFSAVTPAELDRIRFYEDGDYQLMPMRAQDDTGQIVEPLCFLPTTRLYPSDKPWSLADFAAHDLPLAIACAEGIMRYYGGLDRPTVETLWPDIKTKAMAQLGLRPPHPLTPVFDREAVIAAEATTSYQGFFRVEDWRIRHRHHAGGETPVLPRAVLRSGPAATVLPYDPVADLVLVVQQFRIGAFAAGDAAPWLLEPIAGRIDRGETAEATIRREAREEAGITLKRVEKIGQYYPTPGIADEVLHSYVAEATLTEGIALHGLAAEGEDIRAVTLPFWTAMETIGNGMANTGPLLISLLWLARHRHRLRLEWV